MYEYHLDEYMSKVTARNNSLNLRFTKKKLSNKNMSGFTSTCEFVFNEFKKDQASLKGTSDSQALKRQKKAIQGYTSEVTYFKDKIREILETNNLNETTYPFWYRSLVDAIFNENWGFSGMAPWIENQEELYRTSTSAKIIGSKIFFQIKGKMVLQPQEFSSSRLRQLVASLLIDEPDKKSTESFCDVLLLDGTRVTIFGDKSTKPGKQTIIFRKYVIDEFSFEKFADLGTIPEYSVGFFKNLVKLGYNTVFMGGPNTGKSTFYQVYQANEDSSLQGIQIESDPEVDLSVIMPNSPVMELVADDEYARQIMKPILRSDPDYLTVGEARNGVPLGLAMKVASKGSRRVKLTYHNIYWVDLCGVMGEELQESYGGEYINHVRKVARNIGYAIELFYYTKDKSKKYLKGIYEISYDDVSHRIGMHVICKFNLETRDWEWVNRYGDDKKEQGMLEGAHLVRKMEEYLEEFSREHPYNGTPSFYPEYK